MPAKHTANTNSTNDNGLEKLTKQRGLWKAQFWAKGSSKLK